MGQTSHLEPGSFASHLNRYLWSMVSSRGADASGRWLERETDGARKKDYWKKITDNVQAMTTNDIHVVSQILGVSPYQFVSDARSWDGGTEPAFNGPRIGPNVPAQDDDVALAAYDDPDWQARQEAENE